MNSFSINELAPEFAEDGFWEPLRCIYLKGILEVCGDTQRITAKQLPKIEIAINQIFDEVAEGRRGGLQKLIQKHKEGCNEVIEKLSENGWICVYFQLKKKPYRPSLLPDNEKDLINLQQAQKLREQFWAGKLAIEQYGLVVFFIELIACTGLSYSALKRINIFEDRSGHIQVPVVDDVELSIEIPISARAYMLQRWCIAHQETLEGIDNPELLSAMRFQLFLDGCEALVAAQFRRNKLPVPSPNPDNNNPIVFRYLSGDLQSLYGFTSAYQIIPRSQPEVEVITDDSVLLPELGSKAKDIESILPWTLESLATIRQIRSLLRKHLINKHGVFKNTTIDRDTVGEIIFQAKKKTIERARAYALENVKFPHEIEAINEACSYLQHSFTGLELATYRISEHFDSLDNAFDTCMKEISAIFENGILLHPASSNLRNWDEEDLEILINEYLLVRNNGVKLQEITKDQIIKSLRRVIIYGQRSFTAFDNLDVPERIESTIFITKRNHPMGAIEFDHFVQTAEDNICHKVIYYLAFYGGLRSGEIAALTLGSVVCEDDNELWIYIKEGKTPSARRAIPLHFLAPPYVIKEIADYYTEVKRAARVYRQKLPTNERSPFDLKKVHLLNTIHSERVDREITYKAQFPSPKEPAAIIMIALAHMHKRIGTGADLHLLRHSFASNIFLRWYAMKHPEIVKKLSDYGHWLYSEYGLEKLREFLGYNDKEDEKNTDAIHIIKLMGHSSTNTFFEVYVHSFDAVAKHELARINQQTDEIELPGKLITELIPGMRSRASQRKLASRKAKDLVKHLYTSNS